MNSPPWYWKMMCVAFMADITLSMSVASAVAVLAAAVDDVGWLPAYRR